MDRHFETTYKALVRPIPPTINLENVANSPACKTCEYCATIIPDRTQLVGRNIRINFERIDLYPDFPNLKASAKLGCGLCHMIRKTIRATWATRVMEESSRGPLSVKAEQYDELFRCSWDGKVRLYGVSFSSGLEPGNDFDSATKEDKEKVVKLHLGLGLATKTPLPSLYAGYMDISKTVSFNVYDSQGKFWPMLVASIELLIRTLSTDMGLHWLNRKLPSPSALSPQNLNMVSKWIEECTSSHAECFLDHTNRWYPTRLIDVGSLNGEILPRLVETYHGEIRGDFAALSHMWGEMLHRPPLRAFHSNYEELKAGIPKSELPRNFLDAVSVTQKLGLQYIWIDSLCIIQDDPADWKKEATTMHEVYKWAKVTIVAYVLHSNIPFLPNLFVEL